MDWKNQRRGLQFFVVLVALMVGALLVGVMGAAEAAEIRSGLLRANPGNDTHCSVVNYGPDRIGVNELTIEIWEGDGNSSPVLCSSNTASFLTGQSHGTRCGSSQGVYCTVRGNFSTGNVRGVFSNRNSDNESQAAIELK